MGRDCNAELMQHHFFGGSQDETGIQQSKDAIIYVTVSVQYTYLGTTKACFFDQPIILSKNIKTCPLSIHSGISLFINIISVLV